MLSSSLLRAAAIGATAFALAATAAAQSKVGVTSATDGDPLGKPPTENERVLKIGIDVQANEVVSTHANDRAHLVFLDGSSLTVGPNAQLTIDKFVYDPNSKTGELAVTATQGVFRLVGGKISKTSPVSITTPSGTIGIRGGITIFSVSQGRTTANFIFGNNMTVTNQGQSQNVTRPGSQVIVNAGAPPSPPQLLPPGSLTALVGQLEGGGGSTTTGTGTGGTGGGTNSGSGGSAGNADSKAQSSGLSGSNSGSTNTGPPANQPGIGGGPPNTSNNAITNAVSQSGGAANPDGNATPTQTFVPPTTVTTQTQSGYTNGLIVGVNGATSTTRVPAVDLSVPTDFTLKTTAATNTAQATIIIRGLDGTLSSPNATLQLGGNTAASSFLNDSVYALTTTTDPSRPAKLQPLVGTSTTIQDSTVLMSAAVNAALPPGIAVTPAIPQGFGPGQCECAFLTFGYWSSTISYTGTYRTGQSDVILNAPYVAGTVANPVALPNTQSVTYNGFMAGMAQRGTGSPYAAIGNMSILYNFGRGSGAVSGTFDTMAFSGAIANTPGTANLTGSIQMTGAPTVSVSGPIAGSFFSSPTDPAKYIAGGFGVKGIVSGTPYAAGGIFATQR